MNCRLCGSDQVKVLYKDVDGYKINRKFDIYICAKCTIAYTHPFLTKEEYHQYHDRNQVAFNGEGSDDLVKVYMENKKAYWDKLDFSKRLNEIRHVHPKSKSILDIGCGAGFFIDYLRSEGYSVSGIELSPWGYSVAKDVLDLNVKNALIEELNPPKNKFDIITLYDVIEHTTQPELTLASIKKWLKTSGYIIINLPNIDSAVARASGKYWNKLAPPDHTFHFNAQSIGYLLKKSGYKVINIATNSGDPRETMNQLAGGLWRIPASFSTTIGSALDKQYKDYNKNKSAWLKIIKGSKKIAEKAGFVANPILPILNSLKKGEGMRVIAQVS